MDLFSDWESIESHKKFQASPEYGPFSEHLEQIMISAKLYHFHPQPSPPSVLDSAPVTEMAVFFGTDDNFNDNVGRFLAAISEAEGSCGFSHGEIIEDLAKTEYEKPGKAVQLCIGWQSKQLHMRFRESDVFKKNIHLLRKGMSGVEMVSCHTRDCEKYSCVNPAPHCIHESLSIDLLHTRLNHSNFMKGRTCKIMVALVLFDPPLSRCSCVLLVGFRLAIRCTRLNSCRPKTSLAWLTCFTWT